jgi:hypothetical protein
LMKNAGLLVALRGQLTLEHGELLDKRRVAMFPMTRAPTSAVNSAVARPRSYPRDAPGSWRVPW